MNASRSRCLCVLAIFAVLCPLFAWSKPNLTNLAPRGLQTGAVTTIVLDGADLAQSPVLLCPVEGFSYTFKGTPAANRLEVEVKLPASSPGIYPLRVATATGVSNALLVGVDALPQLQASDQPVPMPAAVSGVVSGGAVVRVPFSAKKGQRVVIDLEAQRLGANFKPALRVLDARENQVAFSGPQRGLGGDARLAFTAAGDATYTLAIHDQLYRAAGPGHFRVKLGALDPVDLTLPLGVQLGQSASFRPVGPQLTPLVWQPPQSTVVGPAALPLGSQWPAFTGPAPQVFVSEGVELLEAAPAAPAKAMFLSAAPVAVSGVLSNTSEEDRYEVAVTPKQKLKIELFSQRLGAPIDGLLSVSAVGGAGLGSSDDRPGTSDPGLEVAAPAGAERLLISVKDSLGRGGADFAYRLSIRDASAADFSLQVPSDQIEIPAGGSVVIPVSATRINYGGPIHLRWDGLPPEVQIGGGTIAPGAAIALVTLSAPAGAPLSASLASVVGLATNATPPIVRPVEFAQAAGGMQQPHLRRLLGVAVTRPTPVQLAWNPAGAENLLLGGKTPLRVQLTRGDNVKGKVRIRLQTTQPIPKKTIKVNNQDKVVDDDERTLRLEGDLVLAENAATADVALLVPADLPLSPYDLVLIAELLSADGKNVTAATASPVRTLAPVLPFTLEAASTPLAAKAGAGETDLLRGKVARAAGYEQAVLVTLTGLPKGFTAPQTVVEGKQTEFALPVRFPFGAKAGELKGVKAVAIAIPAAANSVRSNQVDLALRVVPGEKPEAEKPLLIFEDDEAFLALLTQGGGKATPDNRDPFSGKTSIRVTGDQKFNPKLPGLEVKIRENPGPGEYRYVRFAWRKQGGNTICLQLAHDGQFGPGGGRAGALFRYHAGPGPECFGGAVVLSGEVPAKYEVVTRDLFADFGEFTLTGLGFSAVDGQAAFFDHLYLGRTPEDFTLAPKP